MEQKRCLHCGSGEYWLYGTSKGVQRYKCRNCKRYFSDKPRKFSYADKERAIEMVMNNCGIRKTAKFMQCSPYMVMLWIKEFAKYTHESKIEVEGDIIEMDEIFTKVKKNEPH